MSILASCTLSCLLAVGPAWSPASSLFAQAGEPGSYRLKISEQPLGDALQEFSRQSGVQIIFFSGITEGLRAPALDGQYTMTAALDALLSNSKLTFRVINPKTVEVTSAASTQSFDRPAGLAAPARATLRIEDRY